MSSGIDFSKIPAMAPPEGVIPNFDDPETLAPMAKFIMYITSILMFCLFCLRSFVRLRVTHSWGADDCEHFFLEFVLTWSGSDD